MSEISLNKIITPKTMWIYKLIFDVITTAKDSFLGFFCYISSIRIRVVFIFLARFGNNRRFLFSARFLLHLILVILFCVTLVIRLLQELFFFFFKKTKTDVLFLENYLTSSIAKSWRFRLYKSRLFTKYIVYLGALVFFLLNY